MAALWLASTPRRSRPGNGACTCAPAFLRPLHLGDLVPGVQPAAIGNIAGIQLSQAFVRVVAHGDAGRTGKSCGGSSSRTGRVRCRNRWRSQILVPLAVLHHSAPAMVNPACHTAWVGRAPSWAVTSTNSQSISSMRASCNMRSKAGIKKPRCGCIVVELLGVIRVIRPVASGVMCRFVHLPDPAGYYHQQTFILRVNWMLFEECLHFFNFLWCNIVPHIVKSPLKNL